MSIELAYSKLSNQYKDLQEQLAKVTAEIAERKAHELEMCTIIGDKEAEIERLRKEVVSRNQRALDGDNAVAIRDSLVDEIERLNEIASNPAYLKIIQISESKSKEIAQLTEIISNNRATLLEEIERLKEELKQRVADLEFAYKRAKILADKCNIPIHESPEVTGTILGLVRGYLDRVLFSANERHTFEDADQLNNCVKRICELEADCARKQAYINKADSKCIDCENEQYRVVGDLREELEEYKVRCATLTTFQDTADALLFDCKTMAESMRKAHRCCLYSQDNDGYACEECLQDVGEGTCIYHKAVLAQCDEYDKCQCPACVTARKYTEVK